MTNMSDSADTQDKLKEDAKAKVSARYVSLAHTTLTSASRLQG